MDKELQRYYENLLDLFTREGWKQFIEDISDNKEILDLLPPLANNVSYLANSSSAFSQCGKGKP